jgi:hypothetical protein
MNYLKHYSTLILRAQNRNDLEYYEIHHIIPRCLGGTDDIKNLVRLTPEEHFVAHQLLVKIHPDNHKLVYAISLMSGHGTDNYIRNNKLYGWIRKKLSVPKTEEHKRKISLSMSGKIKTDEHKKKISISLSGRLRGPMSLEQKMKISKTLSDKYSLRGE